MSAPFGFKYSILGCECKQSSFAQLLAFVAQNYLHFVALKLECNRLNHFFLGFF